MYLSTSMSTRIIVVVKLAFFKTKMFVFPNSVERELPNGTKHLGLHLSLKSLKKSYCLIISFVKLCKPTPENNIGATLYTHCGNMSHICNWLFMPSLVCDS